MTNSKPELLNYVILEYPKIPEHLRPNAVTKVLCNLNEDYENLSDKKV